ncbi:LCP family protein [Oceanirhabdus sp. W0125-5]|uniref:LCP family protein n=1 Tax=Oceanirhabdus sp. W0125-5 TaxID=2999116 RepID=UPI0022F3309C|nr:LCP family protein [Oceanirhabdus sp. W0125-5]WBW98939.1 LCP family protein [Oceanirhabdus sp. W0125-5]
MKKYVLVMLLAMLISVMKVNVVFGEDYNKLVSPYLFSETEGLKFKLDIQAEVDKYTKDLKRVFNSFNNCGDIEIRSEKGIKNILLVGADVDRNNISRSDTIMIMTLNSKKNTIKITSIMRDTYVHIKGHGYEKINHSFAYGGIKLLKDTIQNNFKVKIDNYAIVDFGGFASIVELFDGIELELSDEERDYIEKFHGEIGYSDVGGYKLNGMQALLYCQMREIGNGAYGRIERQKIFIKQVIKQAKEIKLTKIPKLITEVYKFTKTDIGLVDTIKIGLDFLQGAGDELVHYRLPLDDYSEGKMISKSKGWVIEIDRRKHIEYLHENIFE